jgi:hypothetical protein
MTIPQTLAHRLFSLDMLISVAVSGPRLGIEFFAEPATEEGRQITIPITRG